MRRLLDAGAPLHEFRRVIIGGAPCPPALRARAEAPGSRVVDAYGLSETWGGFALDGVPIAGAEVRLAPATREILVRGAMVMRGYRLDPERIGGGARRRRLVPHRRHRRDRRRRPRSASSTG